MGVTKLRLLLTRCPLLCTHGLGQCTTALLQKNQQIDPDIASRKENLCKFCHSRNGKKVEVFLFLPNEKLLPSNLNFFRNCLELLWIVRNHLELFRIVMNHNYHPALRFHKNVRQGNVLPKMFTMLPSS